MAETVSLTVDAHVAHVELNRPAKLNAMNFEMFGELAALTRSPRSTTLFADVDDTELLELRWQGFRDIREWSTPFHQHIDELYRLRGLASRLRESALFENVDNATLRLIAQNAQFETHGNFEWTHRFQREVSDETFATLRKHFDEAGHGKDLFAAIDIGINPDVKAPSGTDFVSWMGAGTISVGVGENTWAGGENEVPFGMFAHLNNGTLEVDGTPRGHVREQGLGIEREPVGRQHESPALAGELEVLVALLGVAHEARASGLEVVDDDERVLGEEVEHLLRAAHEQRGERLGARRNVSAQQPIDQVVDRAGLDRELVAERA